MTQRLNEETTIIKEQLAKIGKPILVLQGQVAKVGDSYLTEKTINIRAEDLADFEAKLERKLREWLGDIPADTPLSFRHCDQMLMQGGILLSVVVGHKE